VKLKDASKLDEFFRARLRGIFIEQGIPNQDVDAALAQGYSDPSDAYARALACAKISKEAREVFKRVANILDDARAKKIIPGAEPNPKLFVSEGNVEHQLYDAVRTAQEAEVEARKKRVYVMVFESLERLRPTVAAFFDKGGVMVMDPNQELRDNRLALLNWFIAQYLAIADFRLLAGTAGKPQGNERGEVAP
jgi:glycyl-tRNA synthetase beta chain